MKTAVPVHNHGTAGLGGVAKYLLWIKHPVASKANFRMTVCPEKGLYCVGVWFWHDRGLSSGELSMSWSGMILSCHWDGLYIARVEQSSAPCVIRSTLQRWTEMNIFAEMQSWPRSSLVMLQSCFPFRMAFWSVKSKGQRQKTVKWDECLVKRTSPLSKSNVETRIYGEMFLLVSLWEPPLLKRIWKENSSHQFGKW